VFLTRPISLVFVVITVLIFVAMAMPQLKKRRGNITG